MVGLGVGLRSIPKTGEPLVMALTHRDSLRLAVDRDLADARCVNIVVVSSADSCRPCVVIPNSTGADPRNESAGISVGIGHSISRIDHAQSTRRLGYLNLGTRAIPAKPRIPQS